MSITVGALTLGHLQAQPLNYDNIDAREGNTARMWTIQGIVTGAEWASILSIYDTWRNTKILEESARTSKVVGTTVLFSGTGYGGQTWTNIPCWFDSPPSGSQAGSMVSLEFTLVDAAQAIETYTKSEVSENNTEDLEFGTIVLGGVTITLTQYPDVFFSTPTLELTAGGKHYVTGPLTLVDGKEITGYVAAADVAALRTWYKTTAEANPVLGEYYPITPPTFSGFNKLVSGSLELYYEVNMTLVTVL